MADLLTTDDLTSFATIDDDKAQEMIDDAIALAVLIAPCLDSDSLTDKQLAAAKAILRGAVLRWNDAGSGAVSTQTMGPLSAVVDTRQARRSMFWPSEIADLQTICKGPREGGAFSIDTATAEPMQSHALFFGWNGWSDSGFIAPGTDWVDGA